MPGDGEYCPWFSWTFPLLDHLHSHTKIYMWYTVYNHNICLYIVIIKYVIKINIKYIYILFYYYYICLCIFYIMICKIRVINKRGKKSFSYCLKIYLHFYT